MGVYDLPACIDYILHRTQNHRLDYVGYSMGAAMYYVMSSERPEYTKKIRRFAAIAPATYRVMLGTSLAPFLHPLSNKLERMAYKFGVKEFFPSSLNVNSVFPKLCNPNKIFLYPSCNKIVSILSGPIDSSLNRRKLPFFLSYFPDTTSPGCFFHFHQIINTEVFQQYDFGTKANLRKYGQRVPPAYDLSRAVTPTAIFYSSADQITVASGVKRLAREIPNLQMLYRIPKKDLGHLSFIWAENASELFHTKILKFFFDSLPHETFGPDNSTSKDSNKIKLNYNLLK